MQPARLAGVGSWAFKLPDTIEYWSPESFEIFGLDPAKGPPRDIAEFMLHVHPDDREYRLRVTEEILEVGRFFEYTYRIVRPNGEIRVIREVGTPVHENTVLTRFIGAWIDITEQEQRIEELRRSEFYLAEGQRFGHSGSWSFTPAGICDYWSQELYQILGFDPAKGIPTIPDYLNIVHPEDREFVEGTINQMVVEGIGCDVKKRIIRPDGEVRVIRCVGIPVRENGIVTRFIGARRARHFVRPKRAPHR